MKEGQVYKIHSDFYYVNDGKTSFECKAREILKKRKEQIVVGDFVKFENGAIEEILPRKNYIPRPSVSNIDVLVIVSALKEPDLDFTQLNRYLSFAKFYNIQSILCFNKEDLETDDELGQKIKKIYLPLGYEIFFTSAKEGLGIYELKKYLNGKTCVLCGNSGVGKSSIINSIAPKVNLRTKQVSEKTGRGVHTTRHCEIIEADENLRIVDTPGFSNLKFDFLLPQEVSKLFDEINDLRPYCKFKDCLHINESGCAITEHLEDIDETRYNSYLEFVEEAKSYKERVKYEGKKEETSKKIVNNREMAKLHGRKRQVSRNTVKQNLEKQIDE